MFMISKVRLQIIMSFQPLKPEATSCQNLDNITNTMLNYLKSKLPSSIKVEDSITHQLMVVLIIVPKKVV